MNKSDNLRAHLLTSISELKHDPDRLLIFIDNGNVRCTAATSLSFEYSYDLQIILTDFAGHPDSVMLPLLAWLRINQSELLANLEKSTNGIRFEADLLDKSKVDLSLTLPLTERVIVKLQSDGTYDLRHASEPRYTAYQDAEPVQVYANGELLAEWQPPQAGDAMALTTPHPRPDRHE
ncbi:MULTISPECIES: phage tail protein [unclassified Pseudomonas]|uniref:phage tail protein n=1 Tax=unclassified Pseudomonas TaxID=196821 RepID=UPI002B23A2FB|nr:MULTISPECIES: phage tail protein [unclassified Pseudomonas]MEA9976664.1 phage tail protein [Pseudomonas sp. RTS4]MEB0195771.1 phage tail protein [Pseudomonas sp. 5S4]MEB0244740.1 phage tail protein [Pseudomonas sp. 10S5]